MGSVPVLTERFDDTDPGCDPWRETAHACLAVFHFWVGDLWNWLPLAPQAPSLPMPLNPGSSQVSSVLASAGSD